MDYRWTLVELEKIILKTGDARLSHFQHKIVSFIFWYLMARRFTLKIGG
jgi:hypothetical protein